MMKNSLVISLSLVIAVIMAVEVFPLNFAYSDNTKSNEQLKTNEYDFSLTLTSPDIELTPYSPEWKEYNAYELKEMLDLPKEIVEQSTTQELLELVLNYPYIGDIYAFNDIEDALNTIRQNYSPLDELLNRQDLTSVLYNTYSAKTSELFEREYMDETELFERDIQFSVLEALLQKDNLYSELNEAEIKDIAKLAVSVNSILNRNSEFERSTSNFNDFFKRAEREHYAK